MADSTQATAPSATENGAGPSATGSGNTNQPAAESNDPAALAAKLALVLQDNAEKGRKNAELNERVGQLVKNVQDLEKQLNSGKQKELEDGGDYKSLVTELRKTVEQKDAEILALKSELSSAQGLAQQEKLRAAALTSLSRPDVVSAEQLYELLKPRIKEKDGAPVVLNGGVEVPLEQYVETLRAPNSGYFHHFIPSAGPRGMGTTAFHAPAGQELPNNPWHPNTRNLTQQLLIEAQNPELAAALKEQARQASAEAG